MRLGLIGRADDGGLGNLLAEFARHLRPDRVVIMDLGEFGRSAVHLDRYEGLDYRVCHGTALDLDSMDWLLDGCDVLYTAETSYNDALWSRAREKGVVTVLHAMPELFSPPHKPDVLWLPTHWEQSRFSGIAHEIVPVPIAMDRFTKTKRKSCRTFVHVGAPAMRDRNGTEIVLGALKHVQHPCKVVMRGLAFNLVGPEGVVEIECCSGYPDDYWDIWPPDADVLLLPRRYAGLSLPMQEALAQGIPIISLDLEPQRSWPGVMTIPTQGRPQRAAMAGGQFEIHDGSALNLAVAMDVLMADDGRVAELSKAALDYAWSISWERQLDGYRSRFEALAP